MDVLTLLRVALRRWYVVAPVLIATGVAGFMLLSRQAPEYHGSQTLLLLAQEGAPAEALDPGVLSEQAQDGAIRANVETAVGSSTYSITPDDNGILRISTQGSSESAALATFTEVREQLRRLVDEQGGMTHLDDLRTPRSAQVVSEDIWEAQGSVLVRRTLAEGNVYPYDSRSTRELLVLEVTGVTAHREIAGQGFSSVYGASTKKDTPYVVIEAGGPDPVDVEQTLGAVADLAGRSLDHFVEVTSSRPETGFRLEPIGGPALTQASKGVVRSIMALGAVGLLVAIGLAVMAESMAEAMSRRRRTTTSAVVARPRDGGPTRSRDAEPGSRDAEPSARPSREADAPEPERLPGPAVPAGASSEAPHPWASSFDA